MLVNIIYSENIEKDEIIENFSLTKTIKTLSSALMLLQSPALSVVSLSLRTSSSAKFTPLIASTSCLKSLKEKQ